MQKKKKNNEINSLAEELKGEKKRAYDSIQLL